MLLSSDTHTHHTRALFSGNFDVDKSTPLQDPEQNPVFDSNIKNIYIFKVEIR